MRSAVAARKFPPRPRPKPPSPYPRIAAMEQYIQDVLSGVVPACKWVKAACARHLDDLQKQGTEDFPYLFDEALAARYIDGVEFFPHVKGRWARADFVLEPWQCFVIGSVFGWVCKETGLRRFREVYEEVPRKNGKSMKLSAIMLLMLAADGEPGAECYSAATTRDQAKVVFKAAQSMARGCPDYRAHFDVDVLAHSIVRNKDNSVALPLSSDASGLDGLNASFVALDELHAHRDRSVYDVMETSTGARSQPLLWAITTAGTDRAGICYDRREYLCSVLNTTLRSRGGMGYRVEGNSFVDDTLFGVIYTIDAGDPPLAESSLRKANPNYGTSVSVEDLRRKITKAKRSPAALSAFMTKHLCVWMNADSLWMDMAKWDSCADPSLKLEDFSGADCYEGLDAAFKTDVFAKVCVFRKEDHYYAFGKYYMPGDNVWSDGNEHFAAWAREGRITVSPGAVLDIEEVRQDIIGSDDDVSKSDCDVNRYKVKAVGYDPAQLTQFATELQTKGVPMVEVRPSVMNFSPAMKELEALVYSGKFHHNGDPVLAWMIGNVVCHTDKKDNIYPNKEKPQKKIDGVIALLIALSRCMAQNAADSAKVPSVYLSRGIVRL